MAFMNQPNIIMIIGEDTGRYYGCYGDPVATTPNVDRLASEGCRYDNAYSTYPVCAPARSTIVTGQYPMKIATHQMRSTLINPPRLFTHELRNAGYYVNWFTKLDFNFEPTEGWCDDSEDWRDRLRAGEFNDRPFFLYKNISVTHESSMWPDGAETNTTNQFTKNLEMRPAALHNPDDVPVPPYMPDVPEVRGDIARHYDNLKALDDEVGDILDALDASGQADNTIVMFLADHGRGLPREKRWPYTAGLQMPLIIRWPGNIEPGSVEDRLVSWVDIAPTVLSFTGVPIPDDYDGQPFMGPNAQSREYVFGGRDRMDEAYDLVRIVRDKQYHYQRNFFPKIPYAQRTRYMENMQTMQALRRLNTENKLQGAPARFMSGDRPAEELYDLTVDPFCTQNIADQPEHAEALQRLREQLDAFLKQVDDKGLYPERELIDQGLVEDRITAYRERVSPLPPEHRINGITTVSEMHEAKAL